MTGNKNPFFGKTHSKETIKKMSEDKKRNLPENAIKIIIDNVLYNSMNEARLKLNLSGNTILRRVKSSDLKFNNYKYA